MKKKSFAYLLFFIVATAAFSQKSHALSSPNGKIKVNISLGETMQFEVLHEGKQVVAPSSPRMILSNGQALGKSPVLQKAQNRAVKETIIPPVAIKRKLIPDNFNELTLQFTGRYSLQFRAYDDGVAYRFQTQFADSITVTNELAEFKVEKAAKVWFPQVVKRDSVDIFHTSFEEPYQIKPLDSIGKDALMFSPVLVYAGNGLRMVLTESDLEDYPGMFLSAADGALKGVFAPYPLAMKMTEGEFPVEIVTQRADFIARTKGYRSFPWRVMVLGDALHRPRLPPCLTQPPWRCFLDKTGQGHG
jgi:alpha-glucosidase